MTGYKNSYNIAYLSHGILLLRAGTYGVYSFSCTQGKCLTCVASLYSCERSMHWNGELLTLHSLSICLD